MMASTFADSVSRTLRPLSDNPSRKPLRLRAGTATIASANTYRAFIARFFPLLPPAQYEPFVTWRMRVAGSSEFERFAQAAALTYQMIYREPVRALYSTLSMPVLLTAGSKDRSAPLIGYATAEAKARMPGIHEAAQQAMADLRFGRFVSFPDVGHVPHLERPARFRAELLSFLKS